VQERLGEMAKALSLESKELNNRIDENIHSIDCGDNVRLLELINADNINKDEVQKEITNFVIIDSEQEKFINKKIVDVEKKSSDKSKEIFIAQENNKKFKNRDDAQNNKAKLEKSLPEYETKKHRLIKARKAMNLIGLEDSLESKINVLKLKEQELFKAESLVSVSEVTLLSVEKNYKLQKEKEPARQKLLQDQAVLAGFQDKVTTLEEKHDKIKKLQQQVDVLNKTAKGKKLEIEKDKDSLKMLNDELAISRAAKDKYHENFNELEKKNKIQEKFISILAENRKLSNIRKLCLKEKDNFAKIKVSYDGIKENYENLQELFFQGQAGLLATKLKQGEPCPVCGSLQHPSPAKAINGIPDEDKLKNEKKELSKAQAQYNESSENYSKLIGEGKAQKEIVDKLKGEAEEFYLGELMPLEKEELTAHVQNILEHFNIEIKALTLKIAETEKLKAKENKLVELLESTTKNIEIKITQYEETDKLYRDTFTLLSTEKSLFASIKKELPENLDSLDKLSAEIKAKEKDFNTMKLSYENSERPFARLR